MNYTLSKAGDAEAKKDSLFEAFKKLWPLIVEEKAKLGIAFLAILVNSGLTILAPVLVGHTVDTYIITRNYHGVLVYTGYIFLSYLGVVVAGVIQTRTMGGVGQRILFRLRNSLFNKIQELPVAFFNQNKAGDLISRINNDTDKLNQFFSRSLMQFVGNVFIIIGAGIAMLVVNHKLGLASLAPALVLLVFIQLTTAWIKRKNFQSLQALGGLSGEVQESLDNFRVIIAFNRRDYFRKRFIEVNEGNYKAALVAGVANNTYVPVFGLASNAGSMIVITYGLYLISQGSFTFGLLISYLSYVTRFYDPLRQMASLWSDLQTALAGWDRISEIIALNSDLEVIPQSEKVESSKVLEFKGVGFHYPNGKEVLNDVNISMEQGKTYALVGPTGGGKTTTASLIARLYDPTSGQVLLNGRDIKSYSAADRSARISFILQDPFLFTGTVQENILYGNEKYQKLSEAEFKAVLEKDGLTNLLSHFDRGLQTEVTAGGDGISLGQKQLIAFIRAVLRDPEILILDEATANIDTVTEELLNDILAKLSKKTTRVVIAHRLNTIENADEIFFVNSAKVTRAGSLADAVKMLSQGTRES